jgi:hypothetical protein
MMQLLEAATTDKWALGERREGELYSTVPLLGTQWIQLAPSSRLGDITTPWNPNAGGDRRTVAFEIGSEDLREHLGRLDQSAKALYNGKRAWRPTADGRLFRACMWDCQFFDAKGEPTPEPSSWVRLAAIPIVKAQAIIETPTEAWIAWEVKAVMLGRPQIRFL